jgi:hypothetical protein
MRILSRSDLNSIRRDALKYNHKFSMTFGEEIAKCILQIENQDSICRHVL